MFLSRIGFFVIHPKSYGDYFAPPCISFERVEEFIYLGNTLTNHNSSREEIKRRLKLGIACYHSVQNILTFKI